MFAVILFKNSYVLCTYNVPMCIRSTKSSFETGQNLFISPKRYRCRFNKYNNIDFYKAYNQANLVNAFMLGNVNYTTIFQLKINYFWTFFKLYYQESLIIFNNQVFTIICGCIRHVYFILLILFIVVRLKYLRTQYFPGHSIKQTI